MKKAISKEKLEKQYKLYGSIRVLAGLNNAGLKTIHDLLIKYNIPIRQRGVANAFRERNKYL